MCDDRAPVAAAVTVDLARLRRLHRAAVTARTVLAVAAVTAVVAYCFGALQFIGPLQPLDELCARHGSDVDLAVAYPDGGYQPSLFPLSQPCNADFDLVPGWVNPLVVTAAFIAAVAALRLVVLRRRHRAVTAASGASRLDTPARESA